MQAVLQAVDPYKIAQIFGGVWVGISGCIAAAVAPSTQVLSFGMHVGEKLSSVCNAALNNLLQRAGSPALSEDANKWKSFTVDFLCRAITVSTTFYFTRVANAFQVWCMCVCVCVTAYVCTCVVSEKTTMKCDGLRF